MIFTTKHLSMKLKLAILLFMVFAGITATAQTPFSPVKQDAFGFNIGVIDFATPTALDTTSLSSLFKNGKITDFKRMSPSLSLSYWKGLNKYLDFSGKISGVFYDISSDNNNADGFGGEGEATASGTH